ncbi:hypothetical protein SAMN05444722_0504 [Rhodovulum sp. ES.010]|nr:hypothetical protein SAMN05444722_0504 [Rhodovulum sp. ES.010]
MSQASQISRMPTFANSRHHHDESRALLRARIESLLTSGAVASQVSRRLDTKGCRSPWAEADAGAPESAPRPCARPAERITYGRIGWRSNSSRRESL